MGKIATEADVKAVGGKGTATANKCCKKERVSALGCVLTSSRSTNQLVMEGTYKKAITNAYLNCTIYQTMNSSGSQVIIWDFRLNPTNTYSTTNVLNTDAAISFTALFKLDGATSTETVSLTIPSGSSRKDYQRTGTLKSRNNQFISCSFTPSTTAKYQLLKGNLSQS